MNYGVKFLVAVTGLMFVSAGGAIGNWVICILMGEPERMFKHWWFQAITLLINIIGLPILYKKWKTKDQKEVDPITAQSAGIKPGSLLIWGLPMNRRIWVAVLGVCWLVGFILGLLNPPYR